MCRPWYWPVSTHGECHVSTDIYCYKVPHLLTRPRTPLDVTRRSSGVPPGGLRGDWQRSWLLNWILGRVILVADPWLQGLVTKILQGAGAHKAQTPRKIYCRVFSEEAYGQFSIRFVHKCIVWIEKNRHWTILPMPFATTSSSPHALRHRQEQLPHRCKWCLSPGALDPINTRGITNNRW